MNQELHKARLLSLILFVVAPLEGASVLGNLAAPGLAEKYPGDIGIEHDPAVLFHEDFEKDPIGTHWDEVKTRGKSSTPAVQEEHDAPIARGNRSARAQLNKAGQEDVTLVKRLRPGHDELFMRHYVRYGKDYGYHGHGGSGFMADAGKGSFKGAGKAPDGDRFFWATLEPIGGRNRDWKPPGALIFYAYWWQMKPDGRGNHWGNWFEPKPAQIPAIETWLCVEWHVKVNTPERDDGELDRRSSTGQVHGNQLAERRTSEAQPSLPLTVAGTRFLRRIRRRRHANGLV